ncbi:hypothetical protein Plhal710r2_c053g0160571 [Plasmopara halstedii]
MLSYPRKVLDPRRDHSIYVVGIPATTQAEQDQRKALQARFLVPQESPMDRYSAQLRAQSGCAPVPAMRTNPTALAPGKTDANDEELF